MTGASGFIGRAVSAALSEAGAEVHGSWRTRPPPGCVTPHEALLPRDARALLRRVSPRVVVHLAAPIDLEADPTPDLRAGILDATAEVAAACLEGGIRLVHVGSCDEYGLAPPPLAEDGPARPVSAYGAAKLAASERVLALHRSGGLAATVLRPFSTYGPGDRRGIVALACRAALARRPLPITEGGQVREWNHVDATARGIVAAVADDRADGSIVNVGGGPLASVREVVELVFDLAGADRRLVLAGALPRRPGEPDRFWGLHERARALWGDSGDLGLPLGLRATLAWHRRGEAAA